MKAAPARLFRSRTFVAQLLTLIFTVAAMLVLVAAAKH